MSWGWFYHPHHRKTHSRKRSHPPSIADSLPGRPWSATQRVPAAGTHPKKPRGQGWTYGLMVQKSGEKTTWDVWILVNNGISTTNFNWLAGFLNHQPYEEMSQQMFAGFQLWVALEGPKKSVTNLGSTVFCWWYFRMDSFFAFRSWKKRSLVQQHPGRLWWHLPSPGSVPSPKKARPVCRV